MNILSEINRAATQNPTALIETAEKRYDDELLEVSENITQNKNCRIVLIAGPSGSGKTTTAHIIKTKLGRLGKTANVVSLDHFFLPLDKMPLQDNGEADFESVYSLDIPEIHRCFKELLSCGVTQIPVFDFLQGGRIEKTHTVDISDGGYLIVEGLHALNPVLTDELDPDKLLKIYISVNKAVYDDEGNRLLSSRQMRLIRRLSRDAIYRNTDALSTLKLWTSVVRGEEKYLYKFRSTAHIELFTFHCFEPCIFRDIILKMLDGLPETADNYDYVMKAKAGVEKFVSLPSELVPQTSLIREFIKGGCYEDVK